MLNNSINLTDIRIPPSNRLEKLSGKLNIFISFELINNGVSFLNGIKEMLQKFK